MDDSGLAGLTFCGHQVRWPISPLTQDVSVGGRRGQFVLRRVDGATTEGVQRVVVVGLECVHNATDEYGRHRGVPWIVALKRHPAGSEAAGDGVAGSTCRRRRDRTAPHVSIEVDKFHSGSGRRSPSSSRSPAAPLKFTNAQLRAPWRRHQTESIETVATRMVSGGADPSIEGSDVTYVAIQRMWRLEIDRTGWPTAEQSPAPNLASSDESSNYPMPLLRLS